MTWRKLLLGLGALLLTVFLLIQLVPVPNENPPITRTVAWDSPETEQVARAACYDCHSNETVWPWYNNIAPISWRVTMHVIEGRDHLNFSEWDAPQESDLDDVLDVIEDGEMPLSDYLLMHPEANLSRAQKQAFMDGLRITFRQDPPLDDKGRRDNDDDDD